MVPDSHLVISFAENLGLSAVYSVGLPNSRAKEFGGGWER